jgi:CHRD domain
MKDRSCAVALLVVAFLLVLELPIPARAAAMAMDMPKNTLLVAQLDAGQVVGGSQSHATATAAFVLDPAAHRLTYTVTYQGLGADGAGSIGLYNFGPGRNGEAVRMICGKGAAPCPAGGSATISGQLEPDLGRAIDDRLISEFDNGRVYIEVAGANGIREIRGQLAPNIAMVRTVSYVVQLQPAAGAKTKGTGTAVLSQVFLPGGKMAVFYALTVANASGPPTSVALAGPTPGTANQVVLPLPAPGPVPTEAGTPTGGTLTNKFQLAQTTRGTEERLAARLTSLPTTAAGLIVRTTRAPKGELYGTLTPVR